MVNIKTSITASLIIITLILSGVIYQWSHSKDYSILYRNGVAVARSQWKVELEREIFKL